MLVALRCWKSTWLHERVVLRVRSDSMSALILCLKLKTSGAGTAIIAREMALDIAASEYTPQIVEHVPGVVNLIPDELSRRYQPGHGFVLPAALSAVAETKLDPRTSSYFRTVAAEKLKPRKPKRLKRSSNHGGISFHVPVERRGVRVAAEWVQKTPNARKLIKLARPR